jgi:ubiquinone/menaquinone biosynthesis C-methylase UbiE
VVSHLEQREKYAKGGMGRWYWDYRDRKVMAQIGDAQTILDVGCGEGITLERLAREFPEKDFRGIDLSPHNVSLCVRSGLNVQWGDARYLPCLNKQVDCCLLLDVIEHTPEAKLIINEIYRVLRKGGKAIILFPNDRAFFLSRLLFFKFQEAFEDYGHICQWTSEGLTELMSDYEIEKINYLPMSTFWLHCMVVARKTND